MSKLKELNKVIETRTVRPNGTVRIQQDFSNCPTMADQHSAKDTDINYLMKKYKPDEIAQFMAARALNRAEILGHDFSKEPSMQQARGLIAASKQAFEELDPEIKSQFKGHYEFLKFIDNPLNQEKMLKMGLLTKKQVDIIKIDDQIKTPPKMGDAAPAPKAAPSIS